MSPNLDRVSRRGKGKGSTYITLKTIRENLLSHLSPEVPLPKAVLHLSLSSPASSTLPTLTTLYATLAPPPPPRPPGSVYTLCSFASYPQTCSGQQSFSLRLHPEEGRKGKINQGMVNINSPLIVPSFLPPFFLSFFVFLGPHPWHMEIPRLGVKSEL